jgi:hypothetical protein
VPDFPSFIGISADASSGYLQHGDFRAGCTPE